MLLLTDQSKESPFEPITGNRCWHKPDKPRGYERAATHKNAPPLIIITCKAIKAWYFDYKKLLPNLRKLNKIRPDKRSERREMVMGLSQVLVNYTDLATQEVGTWKESGRLNPLRSTFISRKLNCGMKRLYRAFKDLESAGYIRVQRHFNKVTRGCRTSYEQSNYITINESFYNDLGVGASAGYWLSKARKKFMEEVRSGKNKICREFKGRFPGSGVKIANQAGYFKEKTPDAPKIPKFNKQSRNGFAYLTDILNECILKNEKPP